MRALLRDLNDAPPHGHTRVEAAASPGAAAKGADIIALVTASREPVLSRAAVADGAHICAVGACRPDQREMDTALVRDARIFVDSRAGALAEAGDIVIPIKEGAFDASHLAGEAATFADESRTPERRRDHDLQVAGEWPWKSAARALAFERASAEPWVEVCL